MLVSGILSHLRFAALVAWRSWILTRLVLGIYESDGTLCFTSNHSKMLPSMTAHNRCVNRLVLLRGVRSAGWRGWWGDWTLVVLGGYRMGRGGVVRGCSCGGRRVRGVHVVRRQGPYGAYSPQRFWGTGSTAGEEVSTIWLHREEDCLVKNAHQGFTRALR